ncbi:MAG: hypothetical protein JXR52_07945 [Bacteroidales bacterium]|nr:hypothetical protein [Bacteroidales bacterium]
MLKQKLPVDIVLAPEWWHKNTGITFDRDFFFHPARRVECEQKMEQTLYERWGRYGLGADRDKKRPELGAVHLAAGFFLSEILGCRVEYTENHPPLVHCDNREKLQVNAEGATRSGTYKDFESLYDALQKKYGYLTGDINWGGVLNIALDIRGQQLFLDMALGDENVQGFFDEIHQLLSRFLSLVERSTGSTSVSVNRVARYFDRPLMLHSECSHTMISCEDYERYLMKYDILWAKHNRPFGIHYCGNDPHRYAETFAKLPVLDFLDLGWGGDVALLRKHLPDTFFNIRISPVELTRMDTVEVKNAVRKLVTDSGDPFLTGVCCINMDDTVTDDKIDAIFETVEEMRGMSEWSSFAKASEDKSE